MLCFVFATMLAPATQAAKVYSPETLPSQIRRAVNFEIFLSKNNIRNELDGRAFGSLEGEIQLETAPGFNLYKDKFTITAPDGWSLGIIKEPTSIRFLDPITKTLKEGYRGQVLFQFVAKLPSQVLAKLATESKIPIKVGFQACDKELCLLPAYIELPLPLVKHELKAGTNQLPQSPSWLDRQTQNFSNTLASEGLGLSTLFLLLLAGLLTAFTPCVYPLYPITIGIFSKWGSDSKGRTLVLSLVYCLGLTASYAFVGLITASTGAVFGSLTQTPTFLIGIGVLILISAVFFSGFLPFQAPQFLQKIFSGPTGMESLPFSKRLTQAFGMGAGLGVVAAPCVGPMIIALMAWLSGALATSSSAYTQGALALAFFGFGMSLPFFVLANLLVGLNSQPRLGRFTPYFKHVGTVLMLVGSLFFLVPGVKLLLKTPTEAHLSFPVYSLATAPENTWSVIDFRADWCAACYELEAETFSSAMISPYFLEENWSFVQHDLTEVNPANEAVIDEYNIIGLPTVLIQNPAGEICKGLELFGFENAQAFKTRLEKAKVECE